MVLFEIQQQHPAHSIYLLVISTNKRKGKTFQAECRYAYALPSFDNSLDVLSVLRLYTQWYFFALNFAFKWWIWYLHFHSHSEWDTYLQLDSYRFAFTHCLHVMRHKTLQNQLRNSNYLYLFTTITIQTNNCSNILIK